MWVKWISRNCAAMSRAKAIELESPQFLYHTLFVERSRNAQSMVQKRGLGGESAVFFRFHIEKIFALIGICFQYKVVLWGICIGQ
jgi:hypothetical protein